MIVFAVAAGQATFAVPVLVAGLLGLLGLAIVVGPWGLRLVNDLGAERAERVRTQERADMAAHLHDSVLQTLALIQKNAHDSTTVARLARSQERDLRQWLFEADTADSTTLAGALKEMAADVETQHNVVVDVVTVGDCALDEALRPVVHAAREAVVNVAKHAGTQRADVYAETTDSAVDVFVRDRGAGFDVDAVADRPARRPQQHRRPDGPPRRPRGRTLCSRRGHRGPPAHAPHPHRQPRRGEPMTQPSPGGPVRVVLVDDHAMFRAGVRAELAAAGAGVVEVVGEAADADAAIAVVHELQPQVVLLDVHLPGGGGVEVMRRQPSPDALYLALSVSDAAEDVIGTIRGGARGYVTKTITGPELVDAITRVAGGDAVFSPRLAGFVLDAFAGSIDVAAVDEDLDRLTEREREVMRLIARGYAYKEVAKELFISVKTVETHMSSVLRKLQLSSRHELTKWASDRRLL